MWEMFLSLFLVRNKRRSSTILSWLRLARCRSPPPRLESLRPWRRAYKAGRTKSGGRLMHLIPTLWQYYACWRAERRSIWSPRSQCSEPVLKRLSGLTAWSPSSAAFWGQGRIKLTGRDSAGWEGQRQRTVLPLKKFDIWIPFKHTHTNVRRACFHGYPTRDVSGANCSASLLDTEARGNTSCSVYRFLPLTHTHAKTGSRKPRHLFFTRR